MKYAIALALIVAMPALAQTPSTPSTPAAPTGPDAMFAAWDKNHDNAISKDEFRAGWLIARNEMAMQRLRVEFVRHDADKSGKLEAPEYAKLALVQRAGKSAPQMSAFDKNKDGGLQFAEYLDFINVSAPKAK